MTAADIHLPRRAGGHGRAVPLARRNLLSERVRFGMSIVGVAFAVLLILIVVSLYRGWSDVGRFYEQLPGDVWVTQPGTSDPFHSTSFLPLRDIDLASRVPGVRAVTTIYARHIAFRSHGRDLDVFAMALAPQAAVRARARAFVPPRGSIVVDSLLASQSGVRVGDALVVLGRPLVVAQIRNGGTSIFQTAFLNAADARALFAVPGYTNFLLVDVSPRARVAAVAAALRRALPGTETHTSVQFATSFADRVTSGFLAVVGVLVGIGFVVGGAVIALTTYTTTVERGREFGVLKAVGATSGFLYRVVLSQSLIVGVLGAAAGIAGSIAATRLIRDRVPEFITVLRPLDAAAVFAVAVGTAILASYVPARRIDRIDPAEVFRA